MTLEKEFPLRFVPETADAGEWSQLEPLFESLQSRALESVPELERWLEDLGELLAVVYDEGARRYVAYTVDTENKAAEQAHLHFIREIEPRLKPPLHRLNQRYVENPFREHLPRDRFFVLDRMITNDVKLFREENVPLETEEGELFTEYQKVCGAQTVTFRGKELTLQQMAPYLEENDRAVRQEAWVLISERRYQDRDAIEDFYDQAVKVRHRIGRNADFENYRDYCFLRRERFDYTPEDCYQYHQAVERVVVPELRRRGERRRELLGVDTLRPWDTAVDPRGEPPLRPFRDAKQLYEKTHRIFNRLEPALGDQVAFIHAKGGFDLESRKGKAPGGYQATFQRTRQPFIFMNAAGMHRDVETLLHEAGHAFHTFATRDEPLLAYRHSPCEFAEVASQTMEFLTLELLDEYYNEHDARRAARERFESVLGLLCWVATIDAFQHWVYTHPDHTRDQRRAYWVELRRRFGGDVDWRGYEKYLEHRWHAQLHLFGMAFYYIEYGISLLGALMIWQNAREDHAEALRRYQQALALGGSRPLPELFETAGARFEFSEATIGPLIQSVVSEIEARE